MNWFDFAAMDDDSKILSDLISISKNILYIYFKTLNLL